MLRCTFIFFILMLSAGLLGFGNLTTVAVGLAKMLFVVFTLLFLISGGSCITTLRGRRIQQHA